MPRKSEDEEDVDSDQEKNEEAGMGVTTLVEEGGLQNQGGKNI